MSASSVYEGESSNARSSDHLLPSEHYIEQALPRILTLRDLTALFVVILFFITNISNAVAGGPAGLILWAVGAVLFLLPCALATAQLGVLFPTGVSLYTWTHHTFGGFMSFFVGFAAWVPGPLLVLANAELVVNVVQGLNAHWLVQPWQQGLVLVGIIIFSGVVSLQRHRMVKHLVNSVFLLSLLATLLVGVSGLVWLFHGQPSATDFRPVAAWNPFTSANLPLFGVITLGYLGVNLPLNFGGELASPHGKARQRSITRHLLWGSLVVLACYLFSTMGVLVVQGQQASFVLFAPVATVDMALGKIAGGTTAVCMLAVLLIATVVYNNVFARFLLVGSIDQRIPARWGRLNHNRAPASAIVLQTAIACVLAVLFFMVLPYVGVLSGPPQHLAASFYFVVVGTATVLWAFATMFLFVDLLWILLRRRKEMHHHRIAPTWVLVCSSLVGLLAGGAAIIDTILNSYDPPDLPNGTWWYLVAGLTFVALVLGAVGGMLASGEASWQGLKQELSE